MEFIHTPITYKRLPSRKQLVLGFTKMVASGNDFVVIENNSKLPVCPAGRQASSFKLLARSMCDRKYGIGADGLLILEKSKSANIGMRIFNADGSEAEMCGNGARCVALYFSRQSTKSVSPQQKIRIRTKAGIIESVVNKDTVRIKLTKPKALRLNIPIKVNGRALNVNFINTGVPHTVVFVEGLDKIDVFNLGRLIRNHKQFQPAGTNVNFVEILNNNSVRIRTYERGVEDETFACGTGSVASALVFALCSKLCAPSSKPQVIYKINVHTKGGEILKVYYKKEEDNFRDVWLEGKASIVYSGEFLL